MSKKLLWGILSIVLVLAILTTSCETIAKITNGSSSDKNLATLGDNRIFVGTGLFGESPWVICVDLKPTQSVIAGVNYVVDLYEKDKLRDTRIINWNQPEINVQKNKLVNFVATRAEYDAYLTKDISNIFSVKVHEPIPNTQKTVSRNIILIDPSKPASITLISPNGGEHWYMGEKVTITWSSTNLTKDATIGIDIYPDIEHNNIALILANQIPNTGKYTWTVNPIMNAGHSDPVIGSHARVELSANGGAVGVVLTSMSAADFTISAK
jgi:hypothetical protein